VLPAGCKPVGDTAKCPGRFNSEPGLHSLPPRATGLTVGISRPSKFVTTRAESCSKIAATMKRAGQTRLARLRALCAALFLLIAAVSAPITLATQTADACGMACCVKDGYCCCSPHHASVKGQVSDDKPRISEAELFASCPESCAPAGRFSNLLLRNHLRAGAPKAFADEPPVPFLEHVVDVRDLVDSGSSAPRAPPASSTF